MQTKTLSSRNQSMEIAKMVTAILFCISHIEQSVPLCNIASRHSNFGLPMFFAISGYFAYGASSVKLFKRLLHILRLYLIAYIFHLICGCIIVESGGGSTIAYLRAAVPDLEEVILWSVTQHDSFLAHLWTLASTAISYIILWAYTRFQDDKNINYVPLYIISVVLFCCYLVMCVILPSIDVTVHYLAYRNAWFLGIPSFVLGIFLHQYHGLIFERFSLTAQKLAVLFVITYALDILGFHILLPLMVIFLMLLVIAVPRFPEGCFIGKIANKCGVLSTAVYILHITFLSLYYALLQDQIKSVLGDLEPSFQPAIILILSFCGAFIWNWIETCLKRSRT